MPMKFFAVVPLAKDLSCNDGAKYLITLPDDESETNNYASFWQENIGSPEENYEIYSCHLSVERFEALKGQSSFCYTETRDKIIEENNRLSFNQNP